MVNININNINVKVDSIHLILLIAVSIHNINISDGGNPKPGLATADLLSMCRGPIMWEVWATGKTGIFHNMRTSLDQSAS